MVIQGDVDLSKNSRIASYPGSHYKKLEKIRASFRHSGPLEYGADNARNGKGLRSRATDATPPIEFEKRFCFAAGAWGCLENLSDSQILRPPTGTG